MSESVLLSMMNDFFSTDIRVNEYNKWIQRGLSGWEKSVVNNYMKSLGSVLNVGCGCGREAFALYDLGYSVTGVDLSENQIEQAVKNTIQLEKTLISEFVTI